jgi:hypothetical protein
MTFCCDLLAACWAVVGFLGLAALRIWVCGVSRDSKNSKRYSGTCHAQDSDRDDCVQVLLPTDCAGDASANHLAMTAVKRHDATELNMLCKAAWRQRAGLCGTRLFSCYCIEL